ncbi:hypothetical protein NP233_g1170 [Leucocoprinus birnbaumii]|uniref:Uncharacterized protein n=1 Tax=Leucocoprinus birnbaumii TaxID=56174 RepID=A0AAD5YV38_9AGAR|nr:hypothetical protein NP233_g1170 [Leucocoprinus birnbaumii]
MTELIQYNIDDRDPRVSYSGNWTAGGTPSDFNGTLSSSTRVGDFFVVPFWGQSIIIYGHIDTVSGGVITNYSIDGLPPEQAVSPPGTGDIPQQQFWASPTLDNTQHNLTVTMAYINRGDPDPSEGTIWFDFFAVNNQTSTPGGSGNGDGSSGSGSGSGGSGSGGSGSGGGEHTRSLPQNLSRGAIGGIVVGAVLFFCLIGVAVIWSIKERREPRTVYRPTGYWYWPKAPSNTIDHDNPKSSSKHLPYTHLQETSPIRIHTTATPHFFCLQTFQRLANGLPSCFFGPIKSGRAAGTFPYNKRNSFKFEYRYVELHYYRGRGITTEDFGITEG